MPLDGNPLGWVSQVAPIPRDDTVGIDLAPPRLSRRGEPYVASVVPDKKLLADEGRYYAISQPTIGTQLIHPGAGNTSFLDTRPIMYFENREPGAVLFVDFLTFSYFGGGLPAVTNLHWAVVLDLPRRFTTDNTILPPVGATNSGARFSAANILVKAQNSATSSVMSASSPRKKIVGRGMTLLGVSADDSVLLFGARSTGARPGLIGTQAAIGRYVTVFPPVAVTTGFSLTIHLWLASAASGNFNYDLWGGFYLR
jgi:hypothetical protein